MTKALTPIQGAFRDQYLVDYNGTKAIQRAQESIGKKVSNDIVAASMAYEYLRLPQIQAALHQAEIERTRRIQIDQDWVLYQAVQVFEAACMARQYSAANAALTLISKHTGGFNEAHSVTIEANERLQRLLEKLAGEE